MGASKSQKTEAIPRVSVDGLTPQKFFDDFVAQRRPCILVGGLEGAHFDKWSDSYLEKKAGSCEVEVEVRANTSESYGRGKTTKLKFKDFIKRVATGDSNLYLTTQKLGVDLEGRALLTGPPLSQLLADFPPRPALMGHLIPSAYNLWMGYNDAETSSGLVE